MVQGPLVLSHIYTLTYWYSFLLSIPANSTHSLDPVWSNLRCVVLLSYVILESKISIVSVSVYLRARGV